jgi:hypothetical protein
VETIHVEPAAGSIASGYANNAAIVAFGGERPVHEPSIAPDGHTVEKTIHS